MKSVTGSKFKTLSILFFLFFACNVFSQIQVKGIVKGKFENKSEVLNGANVYLKGTSIGTSTDRKGEFTFPKLLKVGDVIEVSYLGYVKKSFKIKATTKFLNIVLLEDQNEMLGAPNSSKRFKSKRFKKKQ